MMACIFSACKIQESTELKPSTADEASLGSSTSEAVSESLEVAPLQTTVVKEITLPHGTRRIYWVRDNELFIAEYGRDTKDEQEETKALYLYNVDTDILRKVELPDHFEFGPDHIQEYSFDEENVYWYNGKYEEGDEHFRVLKIPVDTAKAELAELIVPLQSFSKVEQGKLLIGSGKPEQLNTITIKDIFSNEIIGEILLDNNMQHAIRPLSISPDLKKLYLICPPEGDPFAAVYDKEGKLIDPFEGKSIFYEFYSLDGTFLYRMESVIPDPYYIHSWSTNGDYFIHSGDKYYDYSTLRAKYYFQIYRSEDGSLLHEFEAKDVFWRYDEQVNDKWLYYTSEIRPELYLFDMESGKTNTVLLPGMPDNISVNNSASKAALVFDKNIKIVSIS
ncbi:hypothetical protein ACS3UN_11665 [Oscillospiraceae bacterium LTW-04]|nr:hypothetical protein RBH76_13410 [Oscillospiraceae bacterium MB24-C1]